MTSFLPTVSIIFSVVIVSNVSSFGEAIPVFDEVTVDGCLVEPASASDLHEGFELGQRRVVRVHLPKSFKHELASGFFVLGGRKFSILTSVFPLTRSPLDWDRYCVAEEVGFNG